MLGGGGIEWLAEAMPELFGGFQMRFEICQVSIFFTRSLFPYTKICDSQSICIFNNGSTMLRMICLPPPQSQIFKCPTLLKVIFLASGVFLLFYLIFGFEVKTSRDE